MSKILLLNGSPRGENSNSYKISRAFLRGFGEDTELNIINVPKLNIRPCLGCYSCWKRGDGKCVLRDDMADIYRDIEDADMIVASFPLYFFGIPSQMKTLLDRLLPLTLPYNGDNNSPSKEWRDPSWDEKKLVVVSSCGYSAADPAFEGLKSQLNLIFGENGYTGIFCPQGELFRAEQAKPYTDRYLKRIEAAGEEFARKGTFSEETEKMIKKPVMSEAAFRLMLNHWLDNRSDIS